MVSPFPQEALHNPEWIRPGMALVVVQLNMARIAHELIAIERDDDTNQLLAHELIHNISKPDQRPAIRVGQFSMWSLGILPDSNGNLSNHTRTYPGSVNSEGRIYSPNLKYVHDDFIKWPNDVDTSNLPPFPS